MRSARDTERHQRPSRATSHGTLPPPIRHCTNQTAPAGRKPRRPDRARGLRAAPVSAAPARPGSASPAGPGQPDRAAPAQPGLANRTGPAGPRQPGRTRPSGRTAPHRARPGRPGRASPTGPARPGQPGLANRAWPTGVAPSRVRPRRAVGRGPAATRANPNHRAPEPPQPPNPVQAHERTHRPRPTTNARAVPRSQGGTSHRSVPGHGGNRPPWRRRGA
jgi:hypothetical protein